MYKVILHGRAKKFYENAGIDLQRQLNRAFEQLEENPLYGLHIKRLKGQMEKKYSYRLGGLRIIYEIYKNELIIKVVDIGSRGDIYK